MVANITLPDLTFIVRVSALRDPMSPYSFIEKESPTLKPLAGTDNVPLPGPKRENSEVVPDIVSLVPVCEKRP